MNKRPACKINGFKYPAADQIGGRTSTICRSMACTLLDRNACSPEEELQWIKYFPDKTCAYCGRPASHLDHLHALIIDRKPTGYGTEAANLVPCCDKCNQPKGNLYWEDFMRSSSCQHVGDLLTGSVEDAMERRIQNIKMFQAAMPPKKVGINDELLDKWNELLHSFDEMLKRAQETLMEIKSQVYQEDDNTYKTGMERLMKKITKKKIGECISEALKSKKRNILFISAALEYENFLVWSDQHPEYNIIRCVPGELREERNGILVKTGAYVLAHSELERLNNENSIWFHNAFSEKCINDFEGMLDAIKQRFYINKFPEGDNVKYSLEKMGLFVAFTTPQDPDDWAALDEKYYDLFDEIYLLD